MPEYDPPELNLAQTELMSRALVNYYHTLEQSGQHLTKQYEKQIERNRQEAELLETTISTFRQMIEASMEQPPTGGTDELSS